MSIILNIGNTPLVQIQDLNGSKPNFRLLAKVEGFNPGGSVKDRPALWMLKEAEEKGWLTPEKIILEPTSGNTGIAIAMIAAAKKYRVKIIMPACVSSERQAILQALGAEVELTAADKGTDGAIAVAQELVSRNPEHYFMPYQFGNASNPEAHYRTTGPEIFSQTHGEVDVFVAGIGTTGTLMGVSRYFKEKKPSVRIIGIEPQKKHTIQGLKNLSESQVPEIYDSSLLDGIISVSDEESYEFTRSLAIQEGILAGMSSGAAIAGSLKAGREFPGSTVVTLLPDRGERYLSTTLFRSFCGKCPP